MAITYVRGYDFDRNTANPWNFGNINATGGNLLVYCIAHYTSDSISSVTFNSQELTRAGYIAGDRGNYLYYMFDPPQGTYAGSITGTAGQYKLLVAGVYAGVDTSAIDAVTTKNQTIDTFNLAVTTVADGCITIMAGWSNAWSGATMSAGTDTTLRVAGFSDEQALFEGTTRVDPAGSDTVSFVMSGYRECSGVLASFAPQVDARRKIMVVT